MPRRRLTLATIAVVIAVTTRARTAHELSCPPGFAPDQDNTSCVPSRPSAGPAQGGLAGQAQQFLNSFGQGAPLTAAGALGGVLNSFGLGGGGSGVAPQGSAAPQGYNGGCGSSKPYPRDIPPFRDVCGANDIGLKRRKHDSSHAARPTEQGRFGIRARQHLDREGRLRGQKRHIAANDQPDVERPQPSRGGSTCDVLYLKLAEFSESTPTAMN